MSRRHWICRAWCWPDVVKIDLSVPTSVNETFRTITKHYRRTSGSGLWPKSSSTFKVLFGFDFLALEQNQKVPIISTNRAYSKISRISVFLYTQNTWAKLIFRAWRRVFQFYGRFFVHTDVKGSKNRKIRSSSILPLCYLYYKGIWYFYDIFMPHFHRCKEILKTSFKSISSRFNLQH